MYVYIRTCSEMSPAPCNVFFLALLVFFPPASPSPLLPTPVPGRIVNKVFCTDWTHFFNILFARRMKALFFHELFKCHFKKAATLAAKRFLYAHAKCNTFRKDCTRMRTHTRITLIKWPLTSHYNTTILSHVESSPRDWRDLLVLLYSISSFLNIKIWRLKSLCTTSTFILQASRT